jgi:hypothetical protein
MTLQRHGKQADLHGRKPGVRHASGQVSPSTVPISANGMSVAACRVTRRIAAAELLIKIGTASPRTRWWLCPQKAAAGQLLGQHVDPETARVGDETGPPASVPQNQYGHTGRLRRGAAILVGMN